MTAVKNHLVPLKQCKNICSLQRNQLSQTSHHRQVQRIYLRDSSRGLVKFSNTQIRCQLKLKSAAPQAPMPPTSTLHIFEASPFRAAPSLLPVPAGRYVCLLPSQPALLLIPHGGTRQKPSELQSQKRAHQ